MSDAIHIRDIPCADGQVIEVSLDYRIGGMNYFTSRNVDRGYYLVIQPLRRGPSFTSFQGFSGVCRLLQPAKRFSRTVLESLIADEEVIRDLIGYVVKKNKLVLTRPDVTSGYARLYRTDGTWLDVQPADGESFKLAELYTMLNCQMVQHVPLGDGYDLIIDEEGKLVHNHDVNALASGLLYEAGAPKGDYIAGDALHVRVTEDGEWIVL